MLRRFGYLITFGIAPFSALVAARFCEGGHRCSPPKECCAQGCCYLYAPPSAPRSPPPATDHVLNLFFINHWYFWCVVLAIILAILCACSLWRKRRQLCGWGAHGRHSQSEGDSAGSCYAPPQYSRCSSFHHAPPPYTEVTSKPDLYPLVFTCNGDNGKTGGGASYLMVQYFRNYIVRPVGSLSATSTVDSLSSSFICNANESNTLVPPPYSRAASPDLPQSQQNSSQQQQQQQQSQYQQQQPHHQQQLQQPNYSHGYSAMAIGRSASQQGIDHSGRCGSEPTSRLNSYYEHGISNMRLSESVNFQNIGGPNSCPDNASPVIMSQSDQQFRYLNSCNSSSNELNPTNNQTIIAHNNINSSNKSNTSVSNNNLNSSNNHKNSTNAVYNSCGSIGGISITMPATTATDSDYQDLDVLRRSLETCCQILQQQQLPSASFNSEDSPVNIDVAKRYEGMRGFANSNTGSAVSSLANIGSPGSPPRATSPTGEVKELLEQIRQLQKDNSFDTCQSQGSDVEPKQLLPAPPSKRPSTLQSKKKFFSKPSKTMYLPISNSSQKTARSPVTSGGILGRGRGRRGWVSRSAPTTPGSALPPNRMGDDSPLLNEHDEEGETNA